MPNKFERRTLLKAMAGVPVLGALGFETLRKLKYDAKNNPRKEIVRELGLDDLLSSVKPVTTNNGDLIRVGIVGFGVRGARLAKELGFMEKSRFERELAEEKETGGGPLKTKLERGNFNVSITGICDVFDLHAENGLVAARHDIFTNSFHKREKQREKACF